jgi:hypothetical protein
MIPKKNYLTPKFKPMPDLEQAKQEIVEIKKHLVELKKDSVKIDKILTCLVGDEVSGAGTGLVTKVKTLEDENKELIKDLQKVKDMVAEHRHTILQLKFVVGVIASCIILFLVNKILNQSPIPIEYEKTIKH